MLDDQSNRSLSSSQLFDLLGIEGKDVENMLISCSEKKQAVGRRAHNIVVESMDRSILLQIPVATECSHLPDNREEIPTPEIAQNYTLQSFA